MRRIVSFTCVIGLVVATGVSSQEPDFSEEKSAAKRAPTMLNQLADTLKSDPSNLQIVDTRTGHLPFLGVTGDMIKVVDTKSGEGRRLVIDKKGKIHDYEKLKMREREARFKKFGNLHPVLFRTVERAEQKMVPVMMRLKVDEPDVDKTQLTEGRELEEAAKKLAAQKGKQKFTTQFLAAEILGRQAVQEKGLRMSGPFVRATLPVEQIRKLSRDPRILFIGPDQEKIVYDYPTIAESLPTTRTDVVHSEGATGTGIKVAVSESGGLTEPQACFNIAEIQDGSSAADTHITRAIGIIGNRYNASTGACNGSWQGYAPDADIYVANDSDYQDAYEWAKSKGVNVYSMSWHYTSEETSGSLHSRDEYFDYHSTRYPWPSVFTSAGNQAGSDAYASGKGYNFFGVANILNDGDGDRCNDTISTSSSWKNPTSPHDDREVPEISAPGSRHELLGSSFGGTSAATPVTAGIAACLMSSNTSLKIWPEAIRAILLANANYQDGDGANWSKWSDGKDGAGLINSQYARWTANRRESSTASQYRAHDYGHIDDADFSGGYFTKVWNAYTYTTDAQIRVALTWNSKTTSSTSSVLDADLDLHIYDKDGVRVASSSTWDSSYEFVEFTPTKTGNYTIKVRGWSVPTDFSSYYGVAWTTHYDDCP